MNTERLLKLADFLDQLPPQKFDFTVVVRLGSKSPLEALAAREESCGTAACAMGWLPAVFPKDFHWNLGMCTIEDEFGDWDWRASQEFFDITGVETDFLFDPGFSRLGNNASAKQVAAHIREFIREGGIYES